MHFSLVAKGLVAAGCLFAGSCVVGPSSLASDRRALEGAPPVPEAVLKSLTVKAPYSSRGVNESIDSELLRELSMDTAVRLSVERNPKLKSSYWTFRSSQDLLGASYALWWPTVSLSVGSGAYYYDSNKSGAYTNYTELTDLFSGLSSALPSQSTSGDATETSSSSSSNSADSSSFSSAFDSISGQPNGNYFYSTLNLSLTWNVFDATRPLKIWKSKYQALQDADRYTIAFRDNSLNVQNAYVDLLSSTAKKLAYESIVTNSKYLVRVAKDKNELGVASGLDVSKQQANYYSDLSLLSQSSRDVSVNQAQLAKLMNVNSPLVISLSENLIPLGGWSHTLEQTVQSSEQHRKVVQEMLLDSYLQNANADIEMATYLPTLQLVSQLYGTQTGYWTESYAEFINNPSAVLTFSWTGFDGGQARMRSSSYKKLAESAYQSYLETINDVKENARSGYFEVSGGREIVLATANQVKQSTISLQLQSERYQIGYGTVTDLVQAQTNLAQAVLSYVNQLQDYNKSLLELSRNTGLRIDQDQSFVEAVGNPLGLLSQLSFGIDL